MKRMSIPVKNYADDNEYHILGMHFYNRDVRNVEFQVDLQQILDPKHLKEYLKRERDLTNDSN